MLYDNLSCVSENLLKFYQLFIGEERRILFIFDDFYPMSYDNLSSVSQNVLKFYQQLTGEERRMPFIFDDFHFCCSRVIGLDMTEIRIFTLCCMITWVVFLRMFWNFISSLPVKRGGSFSFLTIFTFVVPELLDLIWRKIGFLPYVVW